MREKRLEVIKCPCCGTEYLPGEIYLPKYFLGQPKEVIRDQQGRVIDFLDESMNLEEHFICWGCNTPFKVMGKVSFNTAEEKSINFNNDYTTSLRKESLFLSED